MILQVELVVEHHQDQLHLSSKVMTKRLVPSLYKPLDFTEPTANPFNLVEEHRNLEGCKGTGLKLGAIFLHLGGH